LVETMSTPLIWYVNIVLLVEQCILTHILGGLLSSRLTGAT